MKRWKSPQSGGFAERLKHYFCHLLSKINYFFHLLSKINYFCHLLHQKLKSSLKLFSWPCLMPSICISHFHPTVIPLSWNSTSPFVQILPFLYTKHLFILIRMCKIFSKVNKSKVCSDITSDGFVFVAPLQLLIGPTTGANKKTVAHTHPHLVLQPLQCIGLLGFQRFWKVVDQYVWPALTHQVVWFFEIQWQQFSTNPEAGKSSHLPSEPDHSTPLATVERAGTDGTFPGNCRRWQ